MTLIDPDVWSVLMRTTGVAHLLNINEIALEDSPKGTLIRGFDATHGAPVFISHIFDDEELDLPFSSLAINDCKSFISKTKFAQSRDEQYRTLIDINSNTNKVETMQFKGKRFKLDFIAGKADTVRAPKGIKDKIAHTFKIDPHDVAAVSQSVKAMGGEDITLVSDGSKLFYEVKIKAKEVFSMELCDEFDSVDTKDNSFVFSYPFKTFYPIIANCESCTFNITTRGILNCMIHDINVYAVPRIV